MWPLAIWPMSLLALFAQATGVHQAALDAYKKHSYAEAISGFQNSLASEKPGTPDYEESVLLLAQSLFLSNRSADAIPYLEKAQRSDEVAYMLGTAYLRARDFKKAEAAFSAMYGLPANGAGAHLLTAQMMMRQSLEADAEKELLEVLKLDPRLPQAHYMLGEVQMFRGAPDDAIASLKQEIALNPNFSMAYYKLGDAYTRKSDWAAAIASLQKSIWLNPDFSGPYILLGKSYLKLSQATNAEGVLRHAVQVDPQNYSAHYLLGQALIQQGRADEGRAMLEEAQKLKK